MRSPEIKPADGGPGPRPGTAKTARSRQDPGGREIFMLVANDSATVVGCNDAFCKVSGRKRSDLVGMRVAEVLDSPDIEAAVRRISSGSPASGATPKAVTVVGRDPRRSVAWYLDGPLIDTADTRYVVIYAIDEARSELLDNERVAEGEARLQAILDTAVDGIVTIDEHGTIESLNTATERIFGYSFEELIGQNVKMLMPDEYRNHHDQYIDRYLRTGEKKIIGIGREVDGRRKDGSTFPLDLAVSEFRVAGKTRFMGLMRDISSRKRAEQEARSHLDELAHASRLSALGEMATGIAHEVNQPLAAIVSYAQACLNLMGSRNVDPNVVINALEQIATQGRRAGDIVHRLRQFVRKEPGERTPVDVNRCIQHVLTLFAHDLRSSNASLTVELGENLPMVTADRVQIEQVALNLLRNAFEATSELKGSRARVKLETMRDGSQGVRVCVSDNGHGFGGAPPDRMFETFYTTKPQGLGVGLSISRSIIESHGGQLQAEQNADGGLDVSFSLPGGVSSER